MSNTDMVTMTAAEVDDLRFFAAAGRGLMDDLKAEVKRLCTLTHQPSVVSETFSESRDVETLRKAKRELEGLWDRQRPPHPVAFAETERPEPGPVWNEAQMQVLATLGVDPNDARATALRMESDD